jgi:hypothetical protein
MDGQQTLAVLEIDSFKAKQHDDYDAAARP